MNMQGAIRRLQLNALTTHSTKNEDAEVELDDVLFAYPSHPNNMVLKGITLKLRTGFKVALVCPCSGGKTTIANLIERLYVTLSRGKYCLTGFLWLKYFTNIYIKRILTKNGECPEFISKFAEKYQTYIGEHGVRLSGCQKQRIATQALFLNPRILLLDEATSALNAENMLTGLQEGQEKMLKREPLPSTWRMKRYDENDQ